MNIRSLALLTLFTSIVLPYATSQITARTLAASAPAPVPPLIPYSSQIAGRTGRTTATFLIYKDQTGGEPLFTESQMIALDETGRYKVQLGESNPSGLPADLFSSGEARWLEVQIAGQPPEARVLLASVPYALKAADAATLGGLPASAFALAGSSNLAAANAIPAVIGPDAAITVTTPGGSTNKLAKFTGTSTVVSSTLYDNGTNVGIGTTAPGATLDVDGTFAVAGDATYKGAQTLAPTHTATSSNSYTSPLLKFYASAYDSSTKAAVQPHFEWQVEPTGNNTAAPNGTLNLLATSGLKGIAETGLYLNSSGTIHFATGQTFPGTGAGTITKITPSSPLTGGGSSGAITLGLNTASLEATLNGVYPRLSGSNTYTGTNAFQAPVSVMPDSSQEIALKSVTGYTGGTGVLGQEGVASQVGAVQGNDAGVWGDAGEAHGTGITGTADDGWGGYFFNNSSTHPTLYIHSQGAGIPASITGSDGSCTIDNSGDLTCTGSKSAAVSVDNKSRMVALYAVESPENWFEDFGSGQISNGSATIQFERTFAQTVNAGVEYHVFLTPKGDCKGLFVTHETAEGFEVRESGSGRSTIAFDYRVVARRKGYETIRLADKTKELALARTPRKGSLEAIHAAR